MLKDVLEEHVQEAAFLWHRRRLAAAMLDLPVVELARIRRRLRAHLDGLFLDPAQGLDFAAEGLTGEDAGLAYVATRMALRLGNDHKVKDLLLAGIAACAADPDGPGSEAARACQWTGGRTQAFIDGFVDAGAEEQAAREVLLEQLLSGAGAAGRVVALCASAGLGRDPGPLLATDLNGSPALRAAAFACIAARRLVLHRRDVLAAVADRSLAGDMALVALLALDPAAAAGQARLLAAPKDSAAPVPIALDLLGVLADAGDVDLLSGASNHPAARRAALLALGQSGRAQALETLLQRLDDPEFGGVAAAAVQRMVGLDALKDAFVPAPPAPDEEVPFDLELPRLDPVLAAAAVRQASEDLRSGRLLRLQAGAADAGAPSGMAAAGYGFADTLAAIRQTVAPG